MLPGSIQEWFSLRLSKSERVALDDFERRIELAPGARSTSFAAKETLSGYEDTGHIYFPRRKRREIALSMPESNGQVVRR